MLKVRQTPNLKVKISCSYSSLFTKFTNAVLKKIVIKHLGSKYKNSNNIPERNIQSHVTVIKLG